MRLFSRNKEAVQTVQGDDVAFESLRRSPRNTRSRVAADAEIDKPPLDPAEASKTRARRRLIGAIALALAAIVFVPMLFDRTPVAPNDDIALQIPDRDTPFEGRRGVPDSSHGPLKASPEPSPTNVPEASPPSATEPAATAPEPAATTPADKSKDPAPAPISKAPAPAAKAADKPAAAPAEKQQPSAAASNDDPRALAALEGRSAGAAEPAGDRNYAVQVAAFSATDKAKGLRDQLVASGLRSYTESVSTAQGLRTRVRLGPFPSRDAADRAKQKLKTMKLDGSVVPL